MSKPMPSRTPIGQQHHDSLKSNTPRLRTFTSNQYTQSLNDVMAIVYDADGKCSSIKDDPPMTRVTEKQRRDIDYGPIFDEKRKAIDRQLGMPHETIFFKSSTN